ncbi:EAL domain-containing protein [Pusillimonas sp.]|uniref:EAL domain-containing protein n=1 Tax=Pusillimonas sp. TaxID=3040095 RepID=UPI0037CB552A
MARRKNSFKSIYVRMFLAICVAIIPSFAGLCFYVYQQRDYLTEYSTQNAERFVQIAARDESWLFTSTRSMFDAISQMPLILQQNWPLCHEYMSSLLKGQQNFHNIGLMSASGTVLCSGLQSDSLNDLNVSDRNYFPRALSEPGMVVSDYYVGRISAKPALIVARAMREADGTPWAVLYASLDVSSMVRSQPDTQFFDGSSITILDRNGIVLNSLPPSNDIQVGRQMSDAPVLELLGRGQKGTGLLERPDGSKWLVSHTRTGTDQDPDALTVVYQHPTDGALANIYRTLWISGALALLLASLTLLLSWMGIQAIVGRNIRYLTAAAKRLSQGKYGTRVAGMVSGQEFKDIATQFDSMAEALGKQEAQWQKSLQRQKGHNKVLQMIAQNRPLDETLGTLIQINEAQIEDSLISILTLTADGKRIHGCVAPSLPESYAEAMKQTRNDGETGTWSVAMSHASVTITTDTANDPSWESIQNLAISHGLRACWSHPILKADGKVSGALTVHNSQPGSPGIEDLQLSKMAAEIASMAIEHSHHHEALRFQSRHDVLTGLYKREVFINRIQAAVDEAAASYHLRLYVLNLTLHGFKEINSTFGHGVGDNLLRIVADRLRTLVGSRGDVSRSSGDEFALLFKSDMLGMPVREMAQSILDEVRLPLNLDGTEMQISASIGIAEYPVAGTEPDVLIRHANSAMERAEREGTGFAFFDASRHERTPNRLLLLSDLRHALYTDELRLHFQPQISLRRRRTVGFEALVRWQHPEKGLLPPGHFMPVAEFSDLIHPLTLWVLDNALAQCRRWHNMQHHATISVNISARNLLNQDFPSQIQKLLTLHNLPAHYLEVEITESAIMMDATRSLSVLHRIRAIGVKIAVDDFGTGHSSLSYLHKLPVDNIKIDQSFIREMESDKESQTIVDSIIGLAHNLKVSVTAEGVEDQRSLMRLLQLGCDFAQGYLISRPIPADETDSWLEQNRC